MKMSRLTEDFLWFGVTAVISLVVGLVAWDETLNTGVSTAAGIAVGFVFFVIVVFIEDSRGRYGRR